MPAPADLDAADSLARFRAEFFLPPGQIYLDGNSLGLLSRRAESSLLHAVAEWAARGIGGWTEAEPRWLDLPERTAEKLAPLLGAAPAELCLTGQTTLNLHQLLATLYRVEQSEVGGALRPDFGASSGPKAPPTKTVILADTLNFASDLYALQSHLRLRGLDPATHLRLVPSRDGRTLHFDDLAAALTAPDVQLAVLPAVVFTSGQLLDVAALTRVAHKNNVLIGWDCSHSIGAVPHTLGGDDGPDFAFWCHYKWLNAGPGAVGGLFLHRRHHHRAPGLAGWWGVRADRRFAMSPTHEPAAGAAALHIGTPPILSLAPLAGSLELIAEAGGIAVLREKSLAQTQLLLDLADRDLAPLGFTIATPRASSGRGGHLALAHTDAWRICQALKAAGVVTDFRAPDLIRLAPSPLYTSFAEIADAVARLREIVATRAHEKFPVAPRLVP